MPSTATITSFYTFTANTKARATHVNTNFSNFRGHIVPIDPNTIAASNETYDLGSTEYRWSTGYFREVDFKSNTSTGQTLQIVGDTAAGQGAFLFKHAGNTRARFGGGGNQYVDLDSTTSQFDFKSAGITLASIKTEGIPRTYISKPTLYTFSMSTTSNITATAVLLGTLSVTSSGRLMTVGLNLGNLNGGTSQTGYLIRTSNTTIPGPIAAFFIYRDSTSTLIGVHTVAPQIASTLTTFDGIASVSRFLFFDSSVSSGNHTYYLYGKGRSNVVIQDYTASASNTKNFQAIELI